MTFKKHFYFQFGVKRLAYEYFTLFNITHADTLCADGVVWSKHALEESLTFNTCSGRRFLISPPETVSGIFKTSLRTSVTRTISAEIWR